MSTSAGWDGVLDGIINEEECDLPDNERGYPGNCGSATIGITYLLSYLVISFLIVINMYIAVILENYSQVIARINVLIFLKEYFNYITYFIYDGYFRSPREWWSIWVCMLRLAKNFPSSSE